MLLIVCLAAAAGVTILVRSGLRASAPCRLIDRAVLGAVRDGPATQAVISRHTEISPAAVERSLARLEHAGQVASVPALPGVDPSNRVWHATSRAGR